MGLLDQIFYQCSFGMAVKAVREGSAFWGIWAMVRKVVCRESMTCLVLGGRSLGAGLREDGGDQGAGGGGVG